MGGFCLVLDGWCRSMPRRGRTGAVWCPESPMETQGRPCDLRAFAVVVTRMSTPWMTRGPDMKHWGETKEIVERIVAFAGAGRRAAMATVVRIEGSSYRRPGARLLVQDDGV